MSDDNAKKLVGALVLLSQAIELAEESNDDCNRLSALLAASEADLTAERTRADKAEAEVARLREVIERAKEYPDLPKGLWNLLDLAAVPVEPQPSPLDALFPGTREALDALTIRTEEAR